MLKELKNSIKKLLSDETFVGTIVLIATAFLLLLTLFLTAGSLNDNDLKARCESIEGKYGKGKCYVKGVEK